MTSLHNKARQTDYGKGSATRLKVTDEQVPWNNQKFFYNPPVYTSPYVLGSGKIENGRLKVTPPVWADSADFTLIKNFNKNQRKSYEGEYYVSSHNLPYNPRGRTGLHRKLKKLIKKLGTQ